MREARLVSVFEIYFDQCLTFCELVMIMWFFLCCVETEHYLPIHRDAPALVDLATGQEILATGIKVDFGLVLIVTRVVVHVTS